MDEGVDLVCVASEDRIKERDLRPLQRYLYQVDC